jgi:oligopeptide/dipeptide ABC transporter ATP-binding protein
MRQRAMIAAALACGPDLLIADEPTTALDVTVQAQVLDLLRKLRRERSMGLLLITHDLGVIAENCDEVLVMYAGRVAERAPVTELFARPRHPYTRGLLASMPRLETPRKTRLPVIEGAVPSLAAMPEGCRFAGRCPWRTERCTREVPALRAIAPNRAVACHHAEAIAEEAWR